MKLDNTRLNPPENIRFLENTDTHCWRLYHWYSLKTVENGCRILQISLVLLIVLISFFFLFIDIQVLPKSSLFRINPHNLRLVILSAGRREIPGYDVEKKRLSQVKK